MHFHLVHAAGLTQWKGGGFGMFSCVDGGADRLIRIQAISDGASFDVSLPGDAGFRSLFETTMRCPSIGNLDDLLTRLTESVWMEPQREQPRAAPSDGQQTASAWASVLSLSPVDFDFGLISRAPAMRHLAKWNPSAIHKGRLRVVSEFQISVYGLQYDVARHLLTQRCLARSSRVGISLEMISARLHLDVEYLQAQWMR